MATRKTFSPNDMREFAAGRGSQFLADDIRSALRYAADLIEAADAVIEERRLELARLNGAPEDAPADQKTGWPTPELMQDDDRGLSRALANPLDARLRAKPVSITAGAPAVAPVMCAESGRPCTRGCSDACYWQCIVGVAIPRPTLGVAALAQEIRRVDGANSLGAGSLAEALLPFIERALGVTAPEPQTKPAAPLMFRHKRTGGLYELIGTARLQTDKPLFDLAEVVAYRGGDGRIWARAANEFDDRMERTRP